MKTTAKRCNQIIKFYDKDRDNKLNYQEYLTLILPLNNSKLRQQVTLREIIPIRCTEFLPYNIEYALAQLFNKELEFNEALEKERLALFNRYDYRSEIAFKVIDTRHSRYITFEMIGTFLKKMQSGAQCEDIIAFMRRVDQDLDCKISFSEFVEALTPIDSHNRVKPSYITPTKTFQNGAVQSSIEALNGITKRKHKIPKSHKSINKSMIYKRSKLPTFNTKTTGTFEVNEMNREQVHSDTKHTTMTESMYRPFKENNENLIFSIMKEQMAREKQIELIKQEIAYQEVTLQNLVSLFDPEEKGIMTAEDLLDALRNIGLDPDKEAASLLFKRFDRDKDGKWDYNDLGDMLVPLEREYAEIICSRQAGTEMPQEALEFIKKLIKTYLHNELIDLNNKKNIKGKNIIEKIFEECDYRNKGYIAIDDVIYILTNIVTKNTK